MVQMRKTANRDALQRVNGCASLKRVLARCPVGLVCGGER